MNHQDKLKLIEAYQVNRDMALKANKFTKALNDINDLLPEGELIDWGKILTDNHEETPFIHFANWVSDYLDPDNPQTGSEGIFSVQALEKELGPNKLQYMVDHGYLDVISQEEMVIRKNLIENLFKIFPSWFFNAEEIVKSYMQIMDESYNSTGQAGEFIHSIINSANDPELQYEVIITTIKKFNLVRMG
jgi:hypothetical protein